MTDRRSLSDRLRPPVPSDPLALMRARGFEPDPWQSRLLRDQPDRVLLLTSRQIGKTEVAAAAAVHEANETAGVTVLPRVRQPPAGIRGLDQGAPAPRGTTRPDRNLAGVGAQRDPRQREPNHLPALEGRKRSRVRRQLRHHRRGRVRARRAVSHGAPDARRHRRAPLGHDDPSGPLGMVFSMPGRASGNGGTG